MKAEDVTAAVTGHHTQSSDLVIVSKTTVARCVEELVDIKTVVFILVSMTKSFEFNQNTNQITNKPKITIRIQTFVKAPSSPSVCQ